MGQWIQVHELIDNGLIQGLKSGCNLRFQSWQEQDISHASVGVSGCTPHHAGTVLGNLTKALQSSRLLHRSLTVVDGWCCHGAQGCSMCQPLGRTNIMLMSTNTKPIIQTMGWVYMGYELNFQVIKRRGVTMLSHSRFLILIPSQ